MGDTTRSTMKAGSAKAGAALADEPAANLLDLLNFDTVADGVRVGDLLRERLATIEARAAAHAAQADDAALAGDAAECAHAEEGGRLDREVRRLRKAIERADERLAEVADAERKAAARAKVAKAAKAADRAEAIAADEYPAAARAVAGLLRELEELQAEVIAAREAAQDAGIGEEASALVLPHERRFQREIVEEREVVVEHHGVRITDAAGNAVRGFGPSGLSRDSSPQRAPERVTRIERVVVQPRHAPPSILRARALLPNPDGGFILDRGEG